MIPSGCNPQVPATLVHASKVTDVKEVLAWNDYRSLIEKLTVIFHISNIFDSCPVWTVPRHRFWCCKTGVAVTDGPNIKVCKACPHGIAFLNPNLSEDFFPIRIEVTYLVAFSFEDVSL